MNIPYFQHMILEWGRHHRRDMPWRDTRDAYKILVSEVMLQQTQVSRVLPKYEKFLREFPTPEALASSSQATLLRTWQGLGYWNRALRLRDAVRMVVNEFGGMFPQDPATLKTLPGVGPYTAGAVACFAFGKRQAVSRYQHPARLPVLLLPRRGRCPRQPHYGDRAPGRVDRRPQRVELCPLRLRRNRARRQAD